MRQWFVNSGNDVPIERRASVAGRARRRQSRCCRDTYNRACDRTARAQLVALQPLADGVHQIRWQQQAPAFGRFACHHQECLHATVSSAVASEVPLTGFDGAYVTGELTVQERL